MRRGELSRYGRPSSPDVTRIVVILSSDTLDSSPRPWSPDRDPEAATRDQRARTGQAAAL
ncbi:MAG: hypothetical protein ACRDS0_10885 [Pseudonocardiaceae bacterium]